MRQLFRTIRSIGVNFGLVIILICLSVFAVFVTYAFIMGLIYVTVYESLKHRRT